MAGQDAIRSDTNRGTERLPTKSRWRFTIILNVVVSSMLEGCQYHCKCQGCGYPHVVIPNRVVLGHVPHADCLGRAFRYLVNEKRGASWIG